MRCLLLLLILYITGFQLSAQEVYISASAAYQRIIDQEEQASLIVNSYHTITHPWFVENSDYSFSHLMQYDLAIGQYLKNNFGYEMKASYTKPFAVDSSSELTSRSFKGSFIRITPSLIMRTTFNKLSIVSKLGGLIGFGRIIYEQQFENNGFYQGIFERATMNYEYNGPVQFGFTASFGVNYAINNRFEVFSELFGVYHVFTPNEGRMTYSSIEGLESTYTTYQTAIEFGSQSESNLLMNNEDRPQKLYAKNYSVSGIGINLGLKFILWKKKDKEESK